MAARYNFSSTLTTNPNSPSYIENYEERVEQRKKEIALEKQERLEQVQSVTAAAALPVNVSAISTTKPKRLTAAEKQVIFEQKLKDIADDHNIIINKDARLAEPSSLHSYKTNPKSSLYIENYEEKVEQRKKEIALEKEYGEFGDFDT